MDVKHRLGRLVVLAIHRGAGGVFKGWHMSISVGISIWQEAQWTGQMTAPRTMIFQRWRPGHCFKDMCCASTFSFPRISESHESVHWWIGSACLLVTAFTAQHTFLCNNDGMLHGSTCRCSIVRSRTGRWMTSLWMWMELHWTRVVQLQAFVLKWMHGEMIHQCRGSHKISSWGMSERKQLTFNLLNLFCSLGFDWTQSSFVSYRCRWYSMFWGGPPNSTHVRTFFEADFIVTGSFCHFFLLRSPFEGCDKKNYQPGDLRGHADTIFLCKTGRIYGWNSLPSLITPVIRRTPAWLKLANRQWCFISPSRGESTTGSRAVCATGSMARMMSWILQLKPRNGGIDFLSRTSFA